MTVEASRIIAFEIADRDVAIPDLVALDAGDRSARARCGGQRRLRRDHVGRAEDEIRRVMVLVREHRALVGRASRRHAEMRDEPDEDDDQVTWHRFPSSY